MKSKSQTSDTETDKPQEIPKELWMMVDHLFRYAKKQVRTCWNSSLRLCKTFKLCCCDSVLLFVFVMVSHWAPLHRNTNTKAGICPALALGVLQEQEFNIPRIVLCCWERPDWVSHVIDWTDCKWNFKGQWLEFIQGLWKQTWWSVCVCVTGRPVSAARPAQWVRGDSGLFGHGQLGHSPYPFTHSLFNKSLARTERLLYFWIFQIFKCFAFCHCINRPGEIKDIFQV